MKCLSVMLIIACSNMIWPPGQFAGSEVAWLAPKDAERWAKQVIAGMPLEKKVAQLVFVDISGGYVTEDDPLLQKWITLVRDHGVGGIVFYGGTSQGSRLDISLFLCSARPFGRCDSAAAERRGADRPHSRGQAGTRGGDVLWESALNSKVAKPASLRGGLRRERLVWQPADLL
jgi:hypothetical protein